MAYKTADFDLVAYMLTLRSPQVKIVELRPYPNPSARHAARGVHYEFILEDADGSDISATLEAIALSFANGELMVEPTLYNAKRGVLRGLILDADKRNRKRGSYGRQ